MTSKKIITIIAMLTLIVTTSSSIALQKALITRTGDISIIIDKNARVSEDLLKEEKSEILALLNHDKKISKKTKRAEPKRWTNKPKSKSVGKTAKKYLGTRYVYGASSKTTKCFDCSSFVQRVYRNHGKKLPRTSRSQSKVGKGVAKRNLKPGDLLFFSTRRMKGIGHVGIYLGKNKFIHASSTKKKIIISSLSKRYYKSHYITARRI